MSFICNRSQVQGSTFRVKDKEGIEGVGCRASKVLNSLMKLHEMTNED
jgi:hypothetical protein